MKKVFAQRLREIKNGFRATSARESLIKKGNIMKKIIAALLMLNSASAFAESKNYEAKYVNQDLTETIVMPKFSNPKGSGSLYLSLYSDLGGVCKLYGLSSYVANSILTWDADSGSSVILDAAAQFKQFISNSSTHMIDNITCRTAENKPIPTSDNYDSKFSNDDGSVTIKTPKFLMANQNLYLSKYSDLDGVCKHYGLSSYVANSMTIFFAINGNSVILDAASKFNRFESNYYGSIDSLICR